MKIHLMKIYLLIIGAAMTCFPITSLYAQSVTIQYGTVEQRPDHNQGCQACWRCLGGRRYRCNDRPSPSQRYQGPGRCRHRRCRTGSCNQWHTATIHCEPGKRAGTTIINTEQQDIRTGDCVSIEQGSYSNIRRISSVHCETKTQIPQHHKSSSIDCEKAKHELTNAETDEAINMAAKKVRILCED